MTARPQENPQLMAELRTRARDWRGFVEAANDARAQLNASIIEAKVSGHSFRQIREATGLSIGAIQMTLAKAGLLSDNTE